MNILLDNNISRVAVIYNRWPEDEKYNTVWCRTVEEVISFLEEDYILDYIFLEHDLDDINQLHYDSPICGMEIVRWLEKCDYLEKFKDTNFILLTNNEKAGRVMLKRLVNLNLKVRYTPFGSSREIFN